MVDGIGWRMMGNFFGNYAPFVPPLASSTSGAWVSYVPIPFQKSCKQQASKCLFGISNEVSKKRLVRQVIFFVEFRRMESHPKTGPPRWARFNLQSVSFNPLSEEPADTTLHRTADP